MLELRRRLDFDLEAPLLEATLRLECAACLRELESLLLTELLDELELVLRRLAFDFEAPLLEATVGCDAAGIGPTRSDTLFLLLLEMLVAEGPLPMAGAGGVIREVK